MRRVGRIGAVAVVAAVVVGCRAIPFDFDTIGGADIAWQAADGRWFQEGVTDPIFVGTPPIPPSTWTNDWPVPGDYDGNGHWEPAVVNGNSWVTAGAAGTIDFPPPPLLPTTSANGPALVAVPADYDGDGRTDPAWFRVKDATWWIIGHDSITLGRPSVDGVGSNDVPVPGDYDGDGRAEPTVFDPTTGTWTSASGIVATTAGPGRLPVPADYDGDRRDDPATVGLDVTPAVTGVWQIPGRPDFVLAGSVPNNASLVPAPADYDGDGRADPAMAGYGPSTTWIILTGSTTTAHTKGNGSPIPSPLSLRVAIVRLTFYGRACLVNGNC